MAARLARARPPLIDGWFKRMPNVRLVPENPPTYRAEVISRRDPSPGSGDSSRKISPNASFGLIRVGFGGGRGGQFRDHEITIVISASTWAAGRKTAVSIVDR